MNFWVFVLKGKYGRNKDFRMEVSSSMSDSSLWKQIATLWLIMLSHIRMNVDNSRRTILWLDKWLEGGDSLEQRCPDTLTLCDKFSMVDSWFLADRS